MLVYKDRHQPWNICVLCVLLWFGINADAVGQEATSVEPETDPPTLESILPPLDFEFYGRIAVLPPKNLGDEKYDWISIAIQDALTQDLWQVEAFEARSLRTFSGKFTEHCPGLELRCITQSDPAVLTNAVGDQYLSYAITGAYYFDDDQLKLELQWHKMRASADELPGPNRIELTATLPALTDSLSVLLSEWLIDHGVELSAERIAQMKRQKSNKPLSLQYTADAYWLQQQYQLDNENMRIITHWATAVKRAIKADRTHPQAWNLLGEHHYNTNKKAEALEAYMQSTKLNDTHIDAIAGLASSQNDTNEGRKLRADYVVRAATLNRGISAHQHNAQLFLSDIDQHEKAIEFANIQSALSRAIHGANNTEFANTIINLAIAYGNLHAYQPAIIMYNAAINIYIANAGDHDVNVANAYYNLGHTHLQLGNYSEAVANSKTALAIYRAILGDHNLNVANTNSNLGLSYHGLDNYDYALEHLQHALDFLNRTPDEQSINLADTLYNIGDVYHDLGNFVTAQKHYTCLLYTSPSPRDKRQSRMPSSA